MSICNYFKENGKSCEESLRHHIALIEDLVQDINWIVSKIMRILKDKIMRILRDKKKNKTAPTPPPKKKKKSKHLELSEKNGMKNSTNIANLCYLGGMIFRRELGLIEML